MGLIKETQENRRLWIAVFVAGIIAGLVLRWRLASFANMPGHGDSAFYYTVAKNVAQGRGPVVDYIVYFFGGLLPLPHYAGDFWNPTASFLIALPMLAFGRSISAALIAPMLAGIVPAVAGFLAGRQYSGSYAVAALTGILTFFSAFQVWFSVTTEAIIFAGAFGSLAIYLIMRGQVSARYFLLAAIFTGLANLIRQDNILLLVALEMCILLATLSWKKKLALIAGALVIHLVVLSPLLAMNYAQLHTIFPTGPGKTAFITTYEDFHSYGKRIDWYTLRATWGIAGIIKRRLHTATENLNQVQYFLTPLLTVLTVAALAGTLLLHRKKQELRLLLPAALFAILEYVFYSVVASFSGPGSLIKSLGTLMPFICMLIVAFFAEYAPNRVSLVVAVCLVAAYSAYQGYSKNLDSTLYYNHVYSEYGIVKSTVLDDASRRGVPASEITILARDTWDVYEGTGFKTVMVPNNDVDTIVSVAQHYDAQYILLPAERPQLDKIYTSVTPDPRFQYIASIAGSDMKIYWLQYGH
jgi:hypothetical protein